MISSLGRQLAYKKVVTELKSTRNGTGNHSDLSQQVMNIHWQLSAGICGGPWTFTSCRGMALKNNILRSPPRTYILGSTPNSQIPVSSVFLSYFVSFPFLDFFYLSLVHHFLYLALIFLFLLCPRILFVLTSLFIYCLNWLSLICSYLTGRIPSPYELVENSFLFQSRHFLTCKLLSLWSFPYYRFSFIISFSFSIYIFFYFYSV